MERGILYLADPLRPGGQGLVFREDEPFLAQAQAALWKKRRRYDWLCVAGYGGAAGVALALAAQLPVDRLALVDSHIFDRRRDVPREILRLERFARRNLALVTSEILLAGASEAELAGMLPMAGRVRLCALRGDPDAALLRAPWEALNEKNLLLPGNRV